MLDLLPNAIAADLDLEVVVGAPIGSLPLPCGANLDAELLLEGILDLTAHRRARSVERIDDGGNVLRLVRSSGIKSACGHLALRYVLNYMGIQFQFYYSKNE